MPGPPQRVADFSGVFPADTAVIAAARRRFTAWLEDGEIPEDVVDDLELVLSELLANAVRAAGAADADLVHVVASFDGEAVVLEVCNPRASWVDPEHRWDLDDPLRTGGRGLLIVESLVDGLEVDDDRSAGTTTVRARKVLATPT